MSPTKTCQICGRGIKAKLGLIAHHGYRRPSGWREQIGTCFGSRHLPFEVSRDHLGVYLVALRSQLATHEGRLVEIRTEKVAVRLTVSTVYRAGKWDELTFEVTRENFAALVATEAFFAKHMIRRMIRRDFDTILASDIAAREKIIREITDYLTQQQARYDAWKPEA